MDVLAPVYSLPGFAEPVGSLSHLVGAAVFAALGLVLIVRADGLANRLALAVFAVSSVTLLSISAVCHMLAEGSGGRAVLNVLDGAAIFVLIAGSHTGVHGLFFRGRALWWPIGLMWGLTAAAIALRGAAPGAVPGAAMTAAYLLAGWGAGLTGVVLWRRLGIRRVMLPLLGGIVYSAGGILLALRQPTLIDRVVGPPEVWHFATLVALSLFWLFLFQNARRAADHLVAS